MPTGKLRPYEPLLMTLQRLGDSLLGAGLFLWLSVQYQMYTGDYVGVALMVFFMSMVCFDSTGIYRSWRGASLAQEIRYVFLGCLAVYVLLMAGGYLLKSSHFFSRRVVLTWSLAWPLTLALERAMIRFVLRHYRKKGTNYRQCVIAGAGDLGRKLARWIEDNPWAGTRLVGFFDDKVTKPVGSHPVLGNLAELPAYIAESRVDQVYIALPMRAESKIRELVRRLADSTASVYMIPDIFLFDLLCGAQVMYFNGFPVVSLRETPLRGMNSLLKRLEDICLAAVILLATAPLMLLIAVGVKLSSPGPVLFRQWRYGLNGQAIQVYKFRTMTVCEDGYRFQQATKCDPRVTRFGAFLRKTSLDELPQFINVLQGRMSVVGPRPHPVLMNEEFRKLVHGYMLRHKVRPGITGLAQVNGCRGETDTLEKMQQRVEYDLEYLRQWSLFLDLKIIVKTVWKGFWGENAY